LCARLVDRLERGRARGDHPQRPAAVARQLHVLGVVVVAGEDARGVPHLAEPALGAAAALELGPRLVADEDVGVVGHPAEPLGEVLGVVLEVDPVDRTSALSATGRRAGPTDPCRQKVPPTASSHGGSL
jgi:hypothetical protein